MGACSWYVCTYSFLRYRLDLAMSFIFGHVCFQDSKPTVKYLPPGYDCTPSKIDTTGTISVKKEDKEAVTKKATPKKRYSLIRSFSVSKFFFT